MYARDQPGARTGHEDSGDLKKTNTEWTRADFASKAPGWFHVFAAAGLEQQQAFIAWQSHRDHR